MRLINYLNERTSNYGSGCSFVDIDETLFSTFAKILVKDKQTGKVVRELDNQEFNSYKLKDNEEYDFQQFRSSEIFYQTSKPIKPMIERIKRMIHKIETTERGKGSKIIFLTAREDFDDKNKFLAKFEKHGIKMSDSSIVYVERAGNIRTGTIPSKKKKIVMDYIKEIKYRRMRMIDDHKGNLVDFLQIEKELPQDIIDKYREKFNIPEGEKVIDFYALYVDKAGKLQQIT